MKSETVAWVLITLGLTMWAVGCQLTRLATCADTYGWNECLTYGK